MEWLQLHWLALLGIGVLGWLADRFLETLTTLTPRSERSEPGLIGLVDMLTTVPRRPRSLS